MRLNYVQILNQMKMIGLYIYEIIDESKIIDINGFCLQNCENPKWLQSIKQMKISIGNKDNKKWIYFKPDLFHCKNNTKLQYFGLSGTDYDKIQKNNLKYIKLEFIENWGDNGACKFVFSYFQLIGFKCQMHNECQYGLQFD